MAHKRFDLSQGIIKNHIIIEKTTVAGTPEGNMKITVDFSGSFDGTAIFTGKPVYNADKKLIEVQNLDYDLQTKTYLKLPSGYSVIKLLQSSKNILL